MRALREPKRGLTAQRHREIGQHLHTMRDYLIHLAVEVGNTYPKSDEFARHIRHALNSLDEARSVGDSKLAREHPHEFTISAYYPGPSKKTISV